MYSKQSKKRVSLGCTAKIVILPFLGTRGAFFNKGELPRDQIAALHFVSFAMTGENVRTRNPVSF